MQINTDWLAEAGLEMPATLDEFTEMLYAFKELHPESIPLGSGAKNGESDPRNYLLNAFGYLWPDTYVNPIGAEPALREGEVVIPAYDDTFVEFLKTA